MNNKIIYVELKSGYGDDGPAWIGFAGYSKSGSTIYFNGKALRSFKGSGIGANYFDAENGDQYWISGVKKNCQDRHWAGGGSVSIDSSCVDEYLQEVGRPSLPNGYVPKKLKPSAPSAEHHEHENQKLEG